MRQLFLDSCLTNWKQFKSIVSDYTKTYISGNLSKSVKRKIPDKKFQMFRNMKMFSRSAIEEHT